MEQENFKEYGAGQEAAEERGIAHTAQLIRAALPYLNSDLQKPLDLFVKGMEFMEAARGFQLRESLSALNVRDKALITDMDGLISEVSKVANPSELKMINLLAGFKNIQKFYETYQALAPFLSGPGGQEAGGPSPQSQPFSGGDLFSDPSSLMKMANMMQMFQSMNTAAPPTAESTASEPPSAESPTAEPTAPAGEAAPAKAPSAAGPACADTNQTTAGEVPKKENSSGSMFDLLSALVPPEQKSTFETLKLLLSSGAAEQPEPPQNPPDGPRTQFPASQQSEPPVHTVLPGSDPTAGIPSDIEAYRRSYYNGFDQIPGIYRGGLIDPTASIDAKALRELSDEEFLPDDPDDSEAEKKREAS